MRGSGWSSPSRNSICSICWPPVRASCSRRAALLQQVWSGDTYVTERTVDTVISRLRRKIERDPQDPEMLLTAWGVGYKFADAATERRRSAMTSER